MQEGIGSAAERQRERNEKLEARFYKLEAQVRELREDHRTDLKRLRMSLDGVRKYYGVQRRQIHQRLSALEKGGDGAATKSTTGNESGSTDAETRSSMAAKCDTWAAPDDDRSQVSTKQDVPRRVQ